ncbi:hypothetical protein Lalb_Chr11g0069101 [Lupinus albus]|uniref:Uncharacterized protein n=1 Tax=Lupinus albus TaxID=3870 RepID=A0A6A4PSI3_LUPAL|nr:hypothetical protein Lalb_Chr11g0069101 [Lupinus albus]
MLASNNPSILLHSNHHHFLPHSPSYFILTSSASRFFMRVASKDSYICRDCGFYFHIFPHPFIIIIIIIVRFIQVSSLILWLSIFSQLSGG